jgi:hypothetical protein
MRRIVGSRDWLGLHNKREEKEGECKRDKGGKPLYGKVCSIDRKGIGIMVFQARQRGKQPLFFIEKAIGNKILLDIRLLSVRE